MTTGKNLKLKRIAMDVSQTALAEQIGVPTSSVNRWESSRVVKDKAAERYLAGLATFGTIPTIEVTTPGAVG